MAKIPAYIEEVLLISLPLYKEVQALGIPNAIYSSYADQEKCEIELTQPEHERLTNVLIHLEKSGKFGVELQKLVDDSDMPLLAKYNHRTIALLRALRAMNRKEINTKYRDIIIAHRAALRDHARQVHDLQAAESSLDDVEAEADYHLWAQKPYWTAREAAALTLGKGPKFVNVRSLRKHDPEKSTSLSEAFYSLLDQIRRARSVGQLREHIEPQTYIDWADKNKIELDPAMTAAVRSLKKPDRRAKGSQKGTWYKIVLGLAVGRYNFDPNAGFGDGQQPMVVTKILQDTNAAGVKVDDQTLRDALREAQEWAKGQVEFKLLKKLNRRSPDAKFEAGSR